MGYKPNKRYTHRAQKGKVKQNQTTWETIECPTCEAGRRRRQSDCGLCKGKGTIKVPREPQ